MQIDSLTSFATGVALNTGLAGTYNIGDLIDLEVVRDIGQGVPLYLVVLVTTTATSGGAATGQFRLVSDATTTISTTTATVHATGAAVAVANMVAGKKMMVIALPMEDPAYERYLGLQQITGTAAFTAGAIDAFLTTNVSAIKSYADAVN